jgi:lysozyme
MPRALVSLPLAVSSACAIDEPAEVDSIQREATACADGPTVYGIDVSRFQGAINWPQVKNHGVVYAWIQISRSLTDIDARFEENWAGAGQVGILRGAYQRFQPAQDPVGQADLFLEKLGPPQPGDLPPMLDVEDDNGLTRPQVASAVRQWIDRVEPVVGVKPVIYTGYYFWRDKVGSNAFADYPLWIANYSATCPLIPDAWSRWVLHQYSSTNYIPGITSNSVDENRFNGTLDDLMALTIGGECGDGVCNGGEDADSCPGDCPPCGVIRAEGGTVDDDSPCFTAGGNPEYIREANGGYGSFLKWTHTTDSADPSNYGMWDLHLEEAGRYRVEAFTQAPYAESRQAVYQVQHGGGETAAEVDQTAVDGWNTVGEYEFAAGGNQSIRVDDNTGEPNTAETQLVFDAIRLTRVQSVGGGEDGGDDGSEPGDNVASACALGGSTGGPAALLLLVPALLALLRRRRPRTGGAVPAGSPPPTMPLQHRTHTTPATAR